MYIAPKNKKNKKKKRRGGELKYDVVYIIDDFSDPRLGRGEQPLAFEVVVEEVAPSMWTGDVPRSEYHIRCATYSSENDLLKALSAYGFTDSRGDPVDHADLETEFSDTVEYIEHMWGNASHATQEEALELVRRIQELMENSPPVIK